MLNAEGSPGNDVKKIDNCPLKKLCTASGSMPGTGYGTYSEDQNMNRVKKRFCLRSPNYSFLQCPSIKSPRSTTQGGDFFPAFWLTL